jgi:hypothetical protein
LCPLPDINWPEIKHNYAHLNDVPIEPLSKGTVDVMLGLDAAALMAPVQVRRGGGGHFEPYAELTPLGWVIAVPDPPSNGQEKRVLCVHESEGEGNANRELRNFWDVDSFGVRAEITSPYTPGEQKALDILDQSCKQQESSNIGTVRPPFLRWWRWWSVVECGGGGGVWWSVVE